MSRSMSDKAKRKAIVEALDKAIANGYDTSGKDSETIVQWMEKVSRETGVAGLYGVIFDPKFAQALWGVVQDNPEAHKNYTGVGPGGAVVRQPWEEHLQQMVIAEDRVKYLRDNS